MITGIILEQFFTEDTILKNTPNLKEPIHGKQKAIQSESLPGIYLFFNQILQSLLTGKTGDLDVAVPVQKDKGMLVDTNLNCFERNREEWIIEFNLLGIGNRGIFNTMAFSDNIEESDRLFNHINYPLNTSEEIEWIPKGAISEKGLQDIVIDVENKKGKNFEFLNILDTPTNKKDIESNDKTLKTNKNPQRINISELFSGDAKNKSDITVEKKVQSDVLQSKGDNTIEEKNSTDNIVRQIILDAENDNRQNDSHRTIIRKDGVAKVHDVKAKLESSSLFQNGGERADFKFENNNNIMQKQVNKDIALNRLQEIEIAKDTPKPQSLNLVLETEGLGKIALRVAVHNNLVKADFIANHINSIIHIQSNLSDLFASLYREGLMPEDFSFYLGDNSRENHKDQYKDRTVASVNMDKLEIKEGIRNQLYNISIKA